MNILQAFVFVKFGLKIMSQIFIFTIIVELYSWIFRDCKIIQSKHLLTETEIECAFFVPKFNFFSSGFRLWCIICKLFWRMNFMCFFFASIHSSEWVLFVTFSNYYFLQKSVSTKTLWYLKRGRTFNKGDLFLIILLVYRLLKHKLQNILSYCRF